MSAGNRNLKTMPRNAQKSGSEASPSQSHLRGLDYSSKIEGGVAHFYGAMGVCTSHSKITVRNPIYCGNSGPRTYDELEEEMNEDANVIRGNDQLEAPLNSSRNNEYANVIRGKDQLEAPLNTSKNNESLVIHQELKGKVVHHYGSLGYGGQYNNIDIRNPMLGFNLGELDTSSGSGSNPNKINDLMHLVPNPSMQTQNYGHYSNEKYSQMGSHSYCFSSQCWGTKNTTHTIQSNPIHNRGIYHNNTPSLYPSSHPSLLGNTTSNNRKSHYIHPRLTMYNCNHQMGHPFRNPYEANECEMGPRFDGGRLDPHQAYENHAMASIPTKRYRTDFEQQMASKYGKKKRF